MVNYCQSKAAANDNFTFNAVPILFDHHSKGEIMSITSVDFCIAHLDSKARTKGFIAISAFVIVSAICIAFAQGQPPMLRMTLLISLSFLQLSLLPVGYLVILEKSKGETRRIWSRPTRDSLIKFSIGCLAVILVMLMFFGLTIRQYGLTSIPWYKITLYFAYYLILIGLVEEFFFRVVPFVLLNKNRSLALLLSCLLFSLYHINEGVSTLPYYAAFGLVFGVLRYHSVSLPVLALVHGTIDFSLLIIWPASEFRLGTINFYFIASFYLLFIALLLFFLLASFARNRQHKA